MSKVFDFLIYASATILGIWVLSVLNEAFVKHMYGFILIDISIPIMAIWIRIKVLSANKPELNILRFIQIFLTGCMVFLSLGFLIHSEHLRDKIGRLFVSGFHVYHYKGINEAGNPMLNSEIYTDHWYSKFGFWVFEVIYLIWILFIPLSTYLIINRNYLKVQERQSTNWEP